MRRRGASVLVANALVCAVVFATTGVVPVFWGVLALMAVGGCSMSLAGVVEQSLVQQRIADGVRARVMAAFQGVFSAVYGTNLALAGVVIDTFSPGAAYVYAGAWCLVASAGFVLVRQQLRREADLVLIRSLRPRAALDTTLAESDLARGA